MAVSIVLFIAAGLAEIGAGYLGWLWRRESITRYGRWNCGQQNPVRIVSWDYSQPYRRSLALGEYMRRTGAFS